MNGIVYNDRKPITGRDAVAKLLEGIYKKFYAHVNIRKTFINNQPALCYIENGRLINCQVFSLQKNVLRNVYFIRNPDKLKALEKNLSKSVTF
jgi:RNA polymerase sigma-70 factor (ECF subfamily)